MRNIDKLNEDFIIENLAVDEKEGVYNCCDLGCSLCIFSDEHNKHDNKSCSERAADWLKADCKEECSENCTEDYPVETSFFKEHRSLAQELPLCKGFNIWITDNKLGLA